MLNDGNYSKWNKAQEIKHVALHFHWNQNIILDNFSTQIYLLTLRVMWASLSKKKKEDEKESIVKRIEVLSFECIQFEKWKYFSVETRLNDKNIVCSERIIRQTNKK